LKLSLNLNHNPDKFIFSSPGSVSIRYHQQAIKVVKFGAIALAVSGRGDNLLAGLSFQIFSRLPGNLSTLVSSMLAFLKTL
jgi:hypothetical protein